MNCLHGASSQGRATRDYGEVTVKSVGDGSYAGRARLTEGNDVNIVRMDARVASRELQA